MSNNTTKTEGDISPSVLAAQDLFLHRPSWYGMLGLAGSAVPKNFNLDDWVEVQIPFVGTYESEVSYGADHVAQWIAEDEEYEQRYIEGIKQSDSWKEFLKELDDGDVELAKQHRTRLEIGVVMDLNRYLKDYVLGIESMLQDAIHERFEYHMIFSEMVSPLEYNFVTDRLYAYIHKNDWAKLNAKEVFKTKLYKEWAHDLYTPRDGYMPFYDKEHFFDEENINHISEGVIAYHLAQALNDDRAVGDEITSLHYVASDAIVSLEMDSSLTIDTTDSYDFYLYRHANPDEWDSR